jgi:cytochrome bd ubiquinol oxidase subunit II
MIETITPWLPEIFAGLLGLSILIYVVLDGFDLGVGILFAAAPDRHRDRMIGSIGPFWDANETWLVLAIGILLVAFPVAHGTILTALYLPVALMLIGLIGRGVAFEFRAKAHVSQKWWWNFVFFAGSAITALSQGAMLGIYVLGLDTGWTAIGFSLIVAVCLAATYAAIGAAWLIHKAEGELQALAVRWMKAALVVTAIGMALISLTTPLASERIFHKWFDFPQMLWLAPLPLAAGALFIATWRLLSSLPRLDDRHSLTPFMMMSTILVLGFLGLAYSFHPYIVPDRITIDAAAAAPESLLIILAGTMVVLPVIIGYSIFAYRVFGGKATDLSYE